MSDISGDNVVTLNEDAIIAWDPQTKIEHFVRRAHFESRGSNIGFLVPTPSRPILKDVDDLAFIRLFVATETKYVKKYVYNLLPVHFSNPLFDTTLGKKNSNVDLGVSVLEQTEIAGMDIAVIQAQDTKSLDAWLKKNNFESGPSVSQWLEPYIKKQWTITAFKFAKKEGKPQINTRAVRMSFKTDRPLFPYREPDTVPETKGRTLRVYLITPDRREAVIESQEPHLAFRENFVANNQPLETLLEGVLSPQEIPKGAWLHLIVDYSRRRVSGTELYFDPCPTCKSSIIPEIVIRVPFFPGGLIFDAFMTTICAFAYFFYRRFAHRNSSA